MKKWALVCGLIGFAFTSDLSASIINIGFLTFDRDAPVTGQNGVSVNNYTGAALGCGVVDPTLPVCTSVNLLNSSLVVNFLDALNVAHTMSIGPDAPIGPGSTVPFNFTFPGILNITSLSFSATIDQTTLTLAPSGAFTVNPNVVSDLLIPSVGNPVILSVNTAILNQVPEPGTISMLAGACFVFSLAAFRRRR